jgi:hypothetical protein
LAIVRILFPIGKSTKGFSIRETPGAWGVKFFTKLFISLPGGELRGVEPGLLTVLLMSPYLITGWFCHFLTPSL